MGWATSKTWKAGIFFDNTTVDTQGNAIAHEVAKSLWEYGIDTELHSISHDRYPEQLPNDSHSDGHDFYILVGCAANYLPSGVASQSQRPVFGISLPQPDDGSMLAVNPKDPRAIVRFLSAVNLKRIKAAAERDRLNVFVQYGSDLAAQDWFQQELEQSIRYASGLNLAIEHGRETPKEFLAQSALIIKCVHMTGERSFDLLSDAQDDSILVPFISPEDRGNAKTILNKNFGSETGGVWVGLNDLKNAIATAHRVNGLKLAELIQYRGSVKDIIRPIDKIGELIFEYSDRYSIFDWGPMPDEISGKGAALAMIADQIFKILDVPHHSRGISELNPRRINVTEIAVLRPERSAAGWDYSKYQARPLGALVPLEVVFRFGLPQGNSLAKRLRDNPGYMATLGLETVPEFNVLFSEPLIEFSTKLEDTDRYLTRDEAQQISGMSSAEMRQLEDLSKFLARELKGIFSRAGFELWDGKFEFAFIAGPNSTERQFMLVDSVGPDELRLTYNGIQISKQILREYYADTQWLYAVATAKNAAKENPAIDWRMFCANELGQVPTSLSNEVRQIAENIYPVIANSIAISTGALPPFPNAWDVSTLVDRIKTAGLA